MKRQKNGMWKLTDAEMNLISILAYEAGEHYDNIGCYALSDDARKKSDEIYRILDEAGFYKD